MKETIDIHFFKVEEMYFAVSDKHYVACKYIQKELVKTLKIEHWDSFLELNIEKQEKEIKRVLSILK